MGELKVLDIYKPIVPSKELIYQAKFIGKLFEKNKKNGVNILYYGTRASQSISLFFYIVYFTQNAWDIKQQKIIS